MGTSRWAALAVLVAACGGGLWLAWRLNAPQPQSTGADTVELDPQRQKEIWHNEHITFQIEKRFGTAFLRAVAAKRREVLEHWLRPTFRGSRPQGSGSGIFKDGLSERTLTSADGTADLDGKAFVAHCLNTVERFFRIERKRLRVLKIARESPGSNRYRTEVLFELAGTAPAGGLRQYSSVQNVVFSIDDGEKLGIVPCLDAWNIEREVWREGKARLFEEITRRVGLDKTDIADNWNCLVDSRVLYRFQIAVEDYDKDGWLDIAVGVRNQRPVLLHSEKGKRFRDVNGVEDVLDAPRPETQECYLAAWVDYDNDGWPDLILGDRLYHNEGGKQFTDVTERSGLRFERECMGIVPGDYDCDGYVDLYVLYHAPKVEGAPRSSPKWVDDDQMGSENRLWRNVGGGRFVDVTDQANAGGGKRHTFAAAWFFYDDDRYPDLYIVNDFGRNVLLRNRGDGTFEDVSADSGAEDFATSMGLATGDIDGDGRTDLYVANMFSKMGRRIIAQVSAADYPPGIYEQICGSCAGNRLYLNRYPKPFVERSESAGVNQVGWAFAPAVFDLDGDGRLDLYATTGFVSFNRSEPDG